MKVTGFIGALGALALPAAASPGQYYPPTCKASKCLSSLNSNAARQSCEAFLQKTVIPCPTTVTKTATTTVTKPTTFVVSKNAVAVSTEEIIEAITSTQTIVDFETVYVPSEVLVTSTSVVPATVTVGGGVDKRFAIKCSPNTLSATALPGCAKACSGASQFSSACSCIGAAAKTITAKQSTATVTTTKTVTKVPTTTVTAVKTLVSVFKTTKTSIVPATLQVTSSVSVASVYTDVTWVEVTSTVSVVAAPVCTQYVIKMVKEGGEIGYLRSVPNSADTMYTTSLSEAVHFYRDSSYLYLQGDHQVKLFVQDNQDNSLPAPVWLTSGQLSPVTCSTGTGADALTLDCHSPVMSDKNKWQVCTGTASAPRLFIGKTFSTDCTAILSLTLEPACGMPA